MHRCQPHGEIKAIGITRALIGKRDVSSPLADIFTGSGAIDVFAHHSAARTSTPCAA